MRIPFAEYWFAYEDTAALERAITLCHELRIPELRTLFSWADWERPDGVAWFDYFIGTLQEARIRLMPCLFYTPYERARIKPGEPYKTSYPPKRLEDYADFVGTMIGRYGKTFEWIQLWNEPNWHVYWDQEFDPDGALFAQMVDPAITVAHRAKKKVVLGGLSPYEPAWVDEMCRYGILQKVQAVGIHAFPGTWDEGIFRRTDRPWRGLSNEMRNLKKQLRKYGVRAEGWYTETGYSTYGSPSEERKREQKQITFFEEVRNCSADRVYWHTLFDQDIQTPTDNTLILGTAPDERAYHFGIIRTDGTPKPLFHHWKKNI